MRSIIAKRTAPPPQKSSQARGPPGRSMNAPGNLQQPSSQSQSFQQIMQQSQPQRQVGQQPPNRMPKAMQQSQMAQQQQNFGGSQVGSGGDFSSTPLKTPKIPLEVAFALTTIRLGKVEQFVMKLQELGIEDSLLNGFQHSSDFDSVSMVGGGGGHHDKNSGTSHDNMMLIEKPVFESLIKRLDALEKQNAEFIASLKKTADETAMVKKNNMISTNNIQTNIGNIQNTVGNINGNLTKYMTDTNTRLQEIETVIESIDNDIKELQQPLNENMTFLQGENEFLSNSDNLNSFNGQTQPILYENSVHDPSIFSQTNPLNNDYDVNKVLTEFETDNDNDNINSIN